MQGIAAVIVLALIEYLVMGGLVGRARVKYKIDAPATTGNPIFERYYRVHQNMLESMMVFVPGVWLFARFLNTPAAIVLGLLFIVARILYAVGYIQAPSRREIGATLTFLINAVLLLGGLVGIALHAV